MRFRGIGFCLAALCFASLALAQDTFTISGANPDGYWMGSNPSVYVSPYQGSISDGANTIFSGSVICDDFTDEVFVPESWTADSSAIGPSGPATGLFNGKTGLTLSFLTGSYDSAQGYNAIAWLYRCA